MERATQKQVAYIVSLAGSRWFTARVKEAFASATGTGKGRWDGEVEKAAASLSKREASRVIDALKG